MHLWRKHATNDWLRAHSQELIARHGGALAIVERPGKRAIVEVASQTRRATADLQREFGGKIEKLRADWLRRFARKSQSKPLRVGSRLIVRRDSDLKDERTIVIPAEGAFGTGEHATTAMSLRILERITRNRAAGWTMLDAGTGSGILAIAGSWLGAKRIVAIDNDPLACSIAARNARANGIRNIDFRTGDALKQKFAGRFDIITANLFSEILIAALPNWSRTVARDGWLILSGVLQSQERALVRALRRNRLAVSEIRRRGKWIAVLASRVRRK